MSEEKCCKDDKKKEAIKNAAKGPDLSSPGYVIPKGGDRQVVSMIASMYDPVGEYNMERVVRDAKRRVKGPNAGVYSAIMDTRYGG